MSTLIITPVKNPSIADYENTYTLNGKTYYSLTNDVLESVELSMICDRDLAMFYNYTAYSKDERTMANRVMVKDYLATKK